MKATINGITIEGTAEEVMALIALASKKTGRKTSTPEEKKAKAEARLVKAAARIDIPEALAAAIKADGDANADGGKMKNFAAFCIYRASKENGKMVANPDTINRLSKVYGISA